MEQSDSECRELVGSGETKQAEVFCLPRRTWRGGNETLPGLCELEPGNLYAEMQREAVYSSCAPGGCEWLCGAEPDLLHKGRDAPEWTVGVWGDAATREALRLGVCNDGPQEWDEGKQCRVCRETLLSVVQVPEELGELCGPSRRTPRWRTDADLASGTPGVWEIQMGSEDVPGGVLDDQRQRMVGWIPGT